MPELALRFILQEPAVSTVIPGMRKLKNVEANIADQRRLGGSIPAIMSDAAQAPVGPDADGMVAVAGKHPQMTPMDTD